MSVVNLGGLTVTEGSYKKARGIVEKKPEGSRKSTNDVLNSLRTMMPGWNITTEVSHWGEGSRNIQIDESILERMAEDPEAMVKFKALILDLEDAVPALEEWAEQNPGQNLDLTIRVDANGTAMAEALVRGLMSGDQRTTFQLPTEGTQSSWSELITKKLEALGQGQVEDAEGSKSWLA